MFSSKLKTVNVSKPSIGKSVKEKRTTLSDKAKRHHEKLWRLTKSGCI